MSTPRLSLNPEDLQVSSFPTASTSSSISTGGAQSWPDVCTCIGICQPTADIYCSGGCPPDTTAPAPVDGAVY
jgi:hypothetical protein